MVAGNTGHGGFEDLECYQLALEVLKEAYSVVRRLPSEEKDNLNSQIRRAAVSVSFNIPEGYGRYHYLDRLRFFYYARGSLMEVLGGFIDCDLLGYTQDELPRQRELCHSALRSLNGYIRYIRNQKQGQSEYGARHIAESPIEYLVHATDFEWTPDSELQSLDEQSQPSAPHTL